jgi:hypothetical protein
MFNFTRKNPDRKYSNYQWIINKCARPHNILVTLQ